MYVTKIKNQLATLFLGIAFIVFVAAVGGNRAPSNPGGATGRSMADSAKYVIKFVAPISGTLDSMGGWMRDNNDGIDTVQFIVYDTTGSGNPLPNSPLDTSGLVLINNNGGFGSFAEFVKAAVNRPSLVSGRTYFVGVLVTGNTGNVYLFRDTASTENYNKDSTYMQLGQDGRPTDNPFGTTTVVNEVAASFFVVISPPSGQSTRVLGGRQQGVWYNKKP